VDDGIDINSFEIECYIFPPEDDEVYGFEPEPGKRSKPPWWIPDGPWSPALSFFIIDFSEVDLPKVAESPPKNNLYNISMTYRLKSNFGHPLVISADLW